MVANVRYFEMKEMYVRYFEFKIEKDKIFEMRMKDNVVRVLHEGM